MHGITIDSGRALDMLASMIEEAEQQYQAHMRETPHYEPASAGEGFVAYGDSINSLFQLLHQRNAQRLELIKLGLEDARQRVHDLSNTDTEFAARLGAVE
ncbi:hypothetical protein [Corynebacterium diphtheriae]|uniref:hypothetical protein n=1 Tax=Corynebacterium diphtheriae TaxID=1717 RepID=UPI000390040C|nr:hypothetical protein [Corynebacterium diphtheriae]ERA54136.1 hypothetical protein B179_02131 [Corynebacterium diphtheriae str. Aberdeen]KLN45047.1 hypothetical protein AL09_02340 [Corynebacterium diphtheriae bv. gravis str. ISS 4749]MBG9369414.1 hypothetical protein [Corynebacterium diphtheriae bv. gravis]MBG9379395.1 hypothetical protein [Corynebacterium diphtheriae bv. gravis]UWE69944.1 hypothetical protein NY056_03505 [Corynebacterium diphtheriae bv. gravis]